MSLRKCIALATVAYLALLPCVTVSFAIPAIEPAWTQPRSHSPTRPMSTDLISYSKPMLSNSKDGMCEDLKKCIEVCMDHVTMMYKECKGQYDMDGYGDMTGNMCWMAKRLCREGCERQMSWKESKEDLKHVKHSEKFKSKAGKAVAQSVIKQLNHDRN